MHNSPFEIFRRNLKPLMVFLTGLALFAFVVLPVLDTYMRRSAGTGGDAVVARFDGNELTRSRVDYFTRNHQSTVRFLVELAQETIIRGGYPRTAGFNFDEQSNQVRSLGINEQPSIEGTIRTFMYASRASKAGFELDDSSLQVWLERFTDGMISNSDIDAMLMQSTQNQMGRPHLYEQLRNHLLSSVYLQRGYAGLFMGESPMSGPLMTPQEQWTNFLKLNRNAVVSTYGVLVNDYLDKTNKNPSESDVVAMYEEGKDRDPNDQSPDPAFHRRYSAKYEYLVGDNQKFLDEEVAKLSEEDIRAEYQRRIKGGEFQLPDAPLSDMLEGGDEQATKSDEPNVDSEGASEDGKGEANEKDNSEKASDTENKSGAEKQAEPSKPSDADADDSPSDNAETESDAQAKPADEKPEPAESGATDDQSRVIPSDAVRLVALQGTEGDTENADESGPEAKSLDDEAEKPAAAREEVADPTDAASKGEEEQEGEKQANEKTAPPTDEPAPQKPESSTSGADEPTGDAQTADDKTGEEKDEAAKDKDEPKVESFEDVRQRLAEEMAGPAARERLGTAIGEATNKMRRYFSELAIYESQVSIGQNVQPPVRPDLKAMAAESGLQYENIGPYTVATITDEPIANSTEAGSEFGGRGPSFSMMMFGFNDGRNELLPQQLFAPVRTIDAPAGKQYVSWKIEETEAYTPRLEEVRDEVVMAIRMKEARELARGAAVAIAKQATAAGDAPITSLAPEGKEENVEENLGPFTWMNSFGFAGATIGNVPQLDSVGEEFMQTVFGSKVGEYGVAMNGPGRVFYVVKPVKFDPPLEELRRQFKQPTNRMMAMLIGNDAGPIIQGFFESVDEQADYTNDLQGDSSRR